MFHLQFARGGSRTAETTKMKRFVITVNGWQPLTIMTKYSILDVAAVLDQPLFCSSFHSVVDPSQPVFTCLKSTMKTLE